MHFVTGLIYDEEGCFRGYVPLKDKANKVQGSNVWKEDEETAFHAHLLSLNEDVLLKSHWPRLDDPEVQVLLFDDAWDPAQFDTEFVAGRKTRARVAQEVVARKRAGL